MITYDINDCLQIDSRAIEYVCVLSLLIIALMFMSMYTVFWDNKKPSHLSDYILDEGVLLTFNMTKRYNIVQYRIIIKLQYLQWQAECPATATNAYLHECSLAVAVGHVCAGIPFQQFLHDILVSPHTRQVQGCPGTHHQNSLQSERMANLKLCYIYKQKSKNHQEHQCAKSLQYNMYILVKNIFRKIRASISFHDP